MDRRVTYTGERDGRRTRRRAGAARPDHHEAVRRPRWTTTPTCCAAAHTGEQVLIDAADEPDRLLDLIGDGGLVHGRHHPPAPRPLAGAGRRGRRRPARRVARARRRRRRHPGADRRDRCRDGDTVTVGDVRAGGHPPRRPHARARSRCSTTTRPARRTCSPATACSRAGSATRSKDPETFASLIDDVEHEAVRPAAGRDLVLPRPRQGHDARRRAPAPAGVARPRLVARHGSARPGSARPGRASAPGPAPPCVRTAQVLAGF